MDRLKQIAAPNQAAMEEAGKQWNGIAKPLHSLGLLEEAVIRIAGIRGNAKVQISKRCVVDMCADNGVVEEGVTQSESVVTAIVAGAMAEGTSNVNLMAKAFGCDVLTVDMGMASDLSDERVIRRKQSYGTKNFAKEPAMSREQAAAAITAGIDMVKMCTEKGYDIIVTGEMGIGNTTTSSAIASVLLDVPPEEVTGRGAGLDSVGLRRKIAVIKQGLALHQPVKEDPIGLLASVGGYDIAGMTGLFLGGAIYHVPVVIDGFISAVSAALAAQIEPLAREYMLASHVSKEPAGCRMLELLGLKPLICAEMCLGEGTGGVLLLPMLDAALAVYHSVHQFDALDIEQYEELS